MEQKILNIINEIRATKELPPVDAIRTEEFLNYFAYDYPAPRGNDPVSITTEVSYAPWNTQHKLVHIGINIFEDGLVNTIGEIYEKLQ